MRHDHHPGTLCSDRCPLYRGPGTEHAGEVVHKVKAGLYRVHDRYDVERTGSHRWEVWQTPPHHTLGVYEASTLTECLAWLGVSGRSEERA